MEKIKDTWSSEADNITLHGYANNQVDFGCWLYISLLSCGIVFASQQNLSIFFTSDVSSQLFALSRLNCPCGFHSMASFLMYEFAFLDVCPILSSSICVFWWLLTPVVVWSSFTSTLLMISGHFTTRMFLRHLFTWTDVIDGFRGWLCFSQDFRFVYE